MNATLFLCNLCGTPQEMDAKLLERVPPDGLGETPSCRLEELRSLGTCDFVIAKR